MKCPKCGGKLKVTHSYQAGSTSRTQRLDCACGVVATAVTLLLNEDPGYGNGAAKTAQRIRQDGLGLLRQTIDGKE